MAKDKLTIVGERIILRRLRFSDVNDIYRNLREREVVRWTLNLPWPYKKDDAVRFIRSAHYEIKRRKGFAFGIVLKEEKCLIGIVSLMNPDWKNKNAECGYWLGKNYWNRGLATEAVGLVLGFAFEELGLHRVYAKLFEKNTASLRVLKKNGFRMEGALREAWFRYKEWHNVLRLGILKQEYEESRKKHAV